MAGPDWLQNTETVLGIQAMRLQPAARALCWISGILSAIRVPESAMTVRRRRLLTALLTIPLTFALAATAGASPADELHALLDEHWAQSLDERVIFRSDPDAFRMNGRLPSVSPEAYDRRRAYNESVLARLGRIDPDALSGQDRVTYKLFRYERLTERDSYEQPDRYFPINALFGYHTYFAQAPANMAFLDASDYDRYLVSLTDFARYNNEHLELLRTAAERGYTQHCAAMAGYDETISDLIVDRAEDSALYGPFTRFPASVKAPQRERYAAQGRQLILATVMPGYRELLDVYRNEYLPNCRLKAGISNVPGGDAYYAYLLSYFTTTDMTPREIHELGLAEMSRIRDEMDAIRRAVDFEGDLRDFFEHLRSSPRFFANSESQLLGTAALIAKTAEGKLPRLFSLLPRGTYDIRSAPNNSAYYMPSSGDGTTSGTYFIGTADLDAQPLYGLVALTLHEGVPGHHLQTALAFEMDLPDFRRHIYHSAYGEGWGLYSERLGLEMGMYDDPYDDFGRLTYEAWRAARLVVDTGIHAFDWSRDDAIAYMLDNTGLTRQEVVDQIDRYITWPAQATSYKIGEIRIRALRETAERELGDRFDIRRFHDTVVGSGSLPIAVLEEVVNEWIAAERTPH